MFLHSYILYIYDTVHFFPVSVAVWVCKSLVDFWARRRLTYPTSLSDSQVNHREVCIRKGIQNPLIKKAQWFWTHLNSVTFYTFMKKKHKVVCCCQRPNNWNLWYNCNALLKGKYVWQRLGFLPYIVEHNRVLSWLWGYEGCNQQFT